MQKNNIDLFDDFPALIRRFGPDAKCDYFNNTWLDEAEHKVVDINAGLESTINIVWNELKYKATLIKDFGNIPPTKCRPGQLNQVFMNLLINAAHAID